MKSTIMKDKIKLYNEDCLQALKKMQDNSYDLAIVDPPYGINLADWDANTPKQEYFTELCRISKNQIIFGGNYFVDKLPITEAWVCWNKKPFLKQQAHFELAWTSFDMKPKMIDYTYAGNCEGIKNVRVDYTKKSWHPAQKPTNLYKLILQEFANEGDKIIDTHLGSGSIAISCHYAGLDLTACEIDKDYYEKALKRIAEETSQTELSFNH